jgi:hypothetical protein
MPRWYRRHQSSDVETADYLREHIDALGSPEANNHYAPPAPASASCNGSVP